MNLGDKEFHIAPMIDVSTVEFRYFIRLLTKRAVIWNQMVVAETLVYRSKRHLLSKEIASCELDSSSTSCNSRDEDNVDLTPDLEKFCGWYDDSNVSGVDPHPIVCQLGSNIPSEAAFATRIAQKCGYDAIDLNSECPSDRVAGRCFGAALMKQPDTAVDVVSAMVQNTSLPVSIKSRIGVDEHSSFEYIASYIKRLVEEAGCKHFIIHARKVYLEGLNPIVKAAHATAPNARNDKQKSMVKAQKDGGKKGNETIKNAHATAPGAQDDEQQAIVASHAVAAETNKLSTQVDKLEKIVNAGLRADKLVCNRMKSLPPGEANRLSRQLNLLSAGGEGTKTVFQASCDKCSATKFTASIITGQSRCPAKGCGNCSGWTMVSDQPLSQELCKAKHREIQQSNTASCGAHYFVEENSCEQNYSSTPAKGSTYKIQLTCDCDCGTHKAHRFEERLSKAETINVYNELNEQLEERTSNQKKRRNTLNNERRKKKKQRKDESDNT